ncbi:MAG: hypothetical protein JW731_13995, partial [Bacteroidales bacterium]|nr:hypothetical protein [Bacteroidales bacterium]
MKRFKLLSTFIVFSAFILTGNYLFADNYSYSDSWGQQGYSVVSTDGLGIQINYSIQNLGINDVSINGEKMKSLELPGQFLPNDEGSPNLPGSGRFIALPQGSTPELKIKSFRTETFENIDMMPAPRIPWANEDGPLEYNKDMAIYSADQFYPAQPIKLSGIDQIRGVDVVMLGITPFQYNPVTKQLLVYRDIEVEIIFKGGSSHFGEDRLRSRWWDPMLSDILLNYESLAKVDYNKSYQAMDDVGCEYLIITPTGPDFQQWADSIRNFRTLQGIQTMVVTLDEIGGNNANTIENYIN